jgi:hypothetical protein
VYDGTTSSPGNLTVSGNIAGDTFTSAALTQVYALPTVLGTNNSIILPANNFNNASFKTSTAGSFITDYNITYTAALGTITPVPVVNTTTTTPPVIVTAPNQLDGTLSSTVAALGSWLNSGGQQQNMPSGLSQNDNVLHLMFTTNGNGQPVVQASWAAFSTGGTGFSGVINLPVNTNPSP